MCGTSLLSNRFLAAIWKNATPTSPSTILYNMHPNQTTLAAIAFSETATIRDWFIGLHCFDRPGPVRVGPGNHDIDAQHRHKCQSPSAAEYLKLPLCSSVALQSASPHGFPGRDFGCRVLIQIQAARMRPSNSLIKLLAYPS